jgi:hypothetical protein
MAKSKNARSEKMKTPQFRVSFPHVFTPAKSIDGGKEKYSIVMLFDKKSDLKEMKKEVSAIIKEQWGEMPKNFQSPFKSGNEKYENNPELYAPYKDHTVITASSMSQPGIVDRRRQAIIDPSEFYAGCYAHATVNAFTWEYMGKKGVSFGLQNVQMLNDGEAFSGKAKAEDDFDAIDDVEDEEDTSSEVGADDFDL